MKKLSIRYPWKQLKRGQGFFVPGLDTDALRAAGLNEALRYQIRDARATPGVLNGLIGVWFFRLPPRQP